MKNIIVNNGFENVELVGGKAYNLKILKDNNINVPDFFVISSEIYELYMQKNIDLKVVEKSINEYCDKYFGKGTLFSIRSSANVEDSDNRSYAGQFKSFLNIKQEEIFEYTQKCWEFASQKGNVKMAVIVQEMVNSEISGIAFTANPEGILNEAVITAGKGLGSNIVEDKIATITYYYNLNDDIYYFEKQDGAIELSQKYIEEIVENLKHIKQIYNRDMDIEWAISANKLYILQARPITTLNNKEIIVLDNSNIVESYPNITMPMTLSTAKIMYSRTFRDVFGKLLGNKEIKKHIDIFDNVLESVNGRMYYRISNWYTFFKFLPLSNKIIKIWQEMLGVIDTKVIYNNNKIGHGVKIKLAIRALNLIIKNNKNMIYVEKEHNKLEEQHNEKMKKKDKYSNLELLKMTDKVITNFAPLAGLALVNDMYTFIFTSIVKKISRNKNNQKEVNEYISNIANLESMKPLNMLNEISINIRKEKKIYLEFSNINTNNEYYAFIKKYRKNDNVKNIKKYINIYGNRVLEELKLETKTYKIDPILLVEKIKNNNMKNYYKNKNIEISNIKCNAILKWAIKNTVKGISQREMTRINRAKALGRGRDFLIQISENLVNSKVIESKEDLWYLEYEELEEYLKSGKINLKQIIKERKQQYEEIKRIPSYSRIIFDGKIFNKKIYSNAVMNYEKSKLLQGTPVSAGEIIGESLIVDDISNIGDVKNKILVTKTTDPGWAFLLKDASGLISERGSLLSHTAIIARELGIPAVVNVKNATKILKNGEKIKLDANKGEVILNELQGTEEAEN